MISCTITIITPGLTERQTYTISIVNDTANDADFGDYTVLGVDPDGNRTQARITRFKRTQRNSAQRLLVKAIDTLYPFTPENRYLHVEVSDRLAARDGWTTN
jgi:hypothetical protein